MLPKDIKHLVLYFAGPGRTLFLAQVLLSGYNQFPSLIYHRYFKLIEQVVWYGGNVSIDPMVIVRKHMLVGFIRADKTHYGAPTHKDYL